MKLPNKNAFKIGSIKARCKTHKEKTIYTITVISTLVLLMTSLMWTPAEATYTTEGFGIFVNGELQVSTITREDAQSILASVKDQYIREGATVVHMGYAEDVQVKKWKVNAQEIKNTEEGIAFIVNRKQPLITVVSTQSYPLYEEVQQGNSYSSGDFSYSMFEKVQAENFKALRACDVLLTMENDLILKSETKNPTLVLTAEQQTGYKGLNFTEEEQMRMSLAFVAPVALNVSCPYGVGRTETGYHLGVDLYNPGGTPILAAAAGIVSYAQAEGSYGNLIIINHGCNVQTYYSHCRSIDVNVGDTVQAGDFIGTVGNTGRTTGTHLHLELRFNGRTLDPMDYL